MERLPFGCPREIAGHECRAIEGLDCGRSRPEELLRLRGLDKDRTVDPPRILLDLDATGVPAGEEFFCRSLVHATTVVAMTVASPIFGNCPARTCADVDAARRRRDGAWSSQRSSRLTGGDEVLGGTESRRHGRSRGRVAVVTQRLREDEHNGPVAARAHPEPTPATVKRLYALAFRCAKPDCTRPLYRQDNDTGDLVLNSRIAHIHARRPGGPRWVEMSSDDNRADDNLLLLCIEHSYEVDELPDQYPAELLREWKQAQRDEHDQLQRGWPLTDAEVGRVLEASSQAVDHHHAGAILGVVRAAERLALAADRNRAGPAARAAEWRAARARVRREFVVWDQDGNPVYAEPSRHETEGLKSALRAALQDVANDLTPLAHDARVELAAARASRPAVAPWCAWVGRTVDEVIAASSTWPGPPGLEDDDRLQDALAALRAATDSLASVCGAEKRLTRRQMHPCQA